MPVPDWRHMHLSIEFSQRVELENEYAKPTYIQSTQKQDAEEHI